jgi:hypothetical protein
VSRPVIAIGDPKLQVRPTFAAVLHCV